MFKVRGGCSESLYILTDIYVTVQTFECEMGAVNNNVRTTGTKQGVTIHESSDKIMPRFPRITFLK